MAQIVHLSEWPKDLVSIFAALGAAMGPRRLSPELVFETANVWGRAVEGHEVTITHLRHSHCYSIHLDGDRWKLRSWEIRSGALEKLCRMAAFSD